MNRLNPQTRIVLTGYIVQSVAYAVVYAAIEATSVVVLGNPTSNVFEIAEIWILTVGFWLPVAVTLIYFLNRPELVALYESLAASNGQGGDES